MSSCEFCWGSARAPVWPHEPKLLFKEFVEVAKSKGEGWVDYMWPKPGEKAPSKKLSYIYRVPGKDVFVGAGVYE
jgi:cytochrome c